MLLIASKSPRRRQLLEQLGIAHGVLDIEVPELRAPGESAIAYVTRVAHDKALAGLAAASEGDTVMAADTEVVFDDVVFGKPVDAADAVRMLRLLSGREHEVISTVWLVDEQRQASASCVTRVRFATLDDADIARYVASGECFGKAGAYAIQGRAAAFVSHLDGSHSSVMGLPLYETAALLKQFGIACVHPVPRQLDRQQPLRTL